MSTTALFLKLLLAHYLLDYPLQGDFLAKAKNHRAPIPGVSWLHALIAHSAIQGGGVWYVTGSVWLGAAEFVMHAAIDWLKSDERIDFSTDQWLHIGCKSVWALVA